MAWWASVVLWCIALALAMMGVRRMWRVGYAWWRDTLPARSCPRCGYDLRGTSGRTCPECAHTARSERALRPGWRRVRAIVVAALLLAAAVGIIRFDHGARHHGLDAALPRPIAVVLLWAVPWIEPLPWLEPWTDHEGGSIQALEPTMTDWQRGVLRNAALRRVRSRDPDVQWMGLWLYAALLPDPGLLRARDFDSVRVLLAHPHREMRAVAAVVAAHGVAEPLSDPGIAAFVAELDLVDDHDVVSLFPILGAMLHPKAVLPRSFVDAVDDLMRHDGVAQIAGRRLAARAAALGHRLPTLVDPLVDAVTPDRHEWSVALLATAWLHADDGQRGMVEAAIVRLLERDKPLDAWAFEECINDPLFPKSLQAGILRRQLEHPGAANAILMAIDDGRLTDVDLATMADELLAAIDRHDPERWWDGLDALVQRIETLRTERDRANR